MALKSILTPENSIIMGAATVAIVLGIYQINAGDVATVHASDAYHPAAGAGIRKAGYTALVAVAGIALLARDPNVAILGGATIIAEQAHFRHAYVTNPETGMMESPGVTAYTPAQFAVPAAQQGTA